VPQNTSLVESLERQATSAYLRGADDATEALWIDAHNECLRHENIPRAARCIFWLVLDLFNRREWARGTGWLARGLTMLEHAGDSPAAGLLAALVSRNELRQGNFDAAAQSAARAYDLARRFNDPELNAFGRLTLALLHARRRQIKEAGPLFDEIMVGVTNDSVSPIAVGVAYCAVIDACRFLYDFGRAREWTIALHRWCAARPDEIAFRGKCLVNRSEILRYSGDWNDAQIEAEQACAWTGSHASSFRYPSGAAFYELGEIHRLRGDLEAATAAYRQASEHDHLPEPGLTLLHFGQGKRDLAAASIRRLMGEPKSASRPEVLLAAVEILTSIGDLSAARLALDQLSQLCEQLMTPSVRAMASHATGAVRMAEGELAAALSSLREAWMLWQDVAVPYEAARVRVLIGQVCQQLGDPVAAQFEFDGALKFFERVSAAPDIARVDSLRNRPEVTEDKALSRRERQVIGLVATGQTNREIARQLSISERTVDRHVSNILLKLNLPSRAAATAYAYQHKLLGPNG
jgi:DNA-binding CsgD family transcriptional regulator